MDYHELQMGGDIIKPIRYHIGEWEALKELSVDWSMKDTILDVGCGIGYGVGMMNLLGFENVIGIDINPDKIFVGKNLGYDVFDLDVMRIPLVQPYDIIWSSHSFEHMKDANLALQKLLQITKDTSEFYFILPYPDISPAHAHTASKEIGLDINDSGETVIEWFTGNGLKYKNHKFSHFREDEIWLEFTK